MIQVKATTSDGDSAAAAEQVRQILTGKRVCPFCGHQNTGATEACPRCTMEDTPATRQATKARIGPWYVLQSRNPAAPGMKYATLLALINKGHVTARSVVRGPTTHQLWRFAAHVRGVSREFGICYSCAGEIDRETSICPYCQRTQDAPAEPDALLEPRLGSVPPSPEATAPEVPSYAARMRELQRQRSVGEAEARSGADRAPVNLPTMQHRQRQDLARRSDGRVVSAMELAAALQDDPANSLRAPRRIFVRAVAALLLMAVAGAAVVWFFIPDYRQPALAWMNRAWTDVKARVDAIDWPKVTTHGNPEKDDIPAMVRAQDVTPKTPAAAPSTPTAPPPVAMVSVEPQTAAAIEPPKAAPAPIPAPAVDPADALDKARKLWGQAIDAEAAHDFVGAAKLLEEIKRLPSDVWPGGLDLRLKLLQNRASQQSSAE
jgi:hypothetical protein